MKLDDLEPKPPNLPKPGTLTIGTGKPIRFLEWGQCQGVCGENNHICRFKVYSDGHCKDSNARDKILNQGVNFWDDLRKCSTSVPITMALRPL